MAKRYRRERLPERALARNPGSAEMPPWDFTSSFTIHHGIPGRRPQAGSAPVAIRGDGQKLGSGFRSVMKPP